MRLSRAQKDALLAARGGGRIVRVGSRVAIVWSEPDAGRKERWRGLFVHVVQIPKIWWEGMECAAGTRRAVVALLAGAP